MSARRKPVPAPEPLAGQASPKYAPRIVTFGRSGTTPLRLKARLIATESQTLHDGDEVAGLSVGLWACVHNGWVASLEIDARGAGTAHAVRLDSLENAVPWAETAVRAAFDGQAGPRRHAPVSLPHAADHALQRFARARLARRAATEAVAMTERLLHELAAGSGEAGSRAATGSAR